MIANALRVDVELFARVRCRENPLFVMAEQGRVSRACVRSYLKNLHYLISNSVPCLRRAAERAREENDEALALHFEAKLAEEAGHEVWAERDLESVRESSTMLTPEVTYGMRGVLENVHELIERNPALYLSYLLFAEYVTVLIGPAWVALLEERCGIARTSLTIVTKHIELDVDHVEHALDEIDDLVGEPTMLPQMRAALHASMARFERFCTELAEIHEKDNEREHRDYQPSISAA